MSNIGLACTGDEQLTVSSTSVALASIPAGSHRAMIRVRSANIFMTMDAVAASTANGMQVDQDSFINLTDAKYTLQDIRFIREASTDATVDVIYYS